MGLQVEAAGINFLNKVLINSRERRFLKLNAEIFVQQALPVGSQKMENFAEFIFVIESFTVNFAEFVFTMDRFERTEGEKIHIKGKSLFI